MLDASKTARTHDHPIKQTAALRRAVMYQDLHEDEAVCINVRDNSITAEFGMLTNCPSVLFHISPPHANTAAMKLATMATALH